MNHDYKKKKRVVIAALSILAVCLAVGLIWYVGTLGNSQPSMAQTQTGDRQEAEETVIVPDIKPESTERASSTAEEPATEPETKSEPPVTESETEPPRTTEPKPAQPKVESSAAVKSVPEAVRTKPSENKPKAPEEAVPPSEPPVDESTVSTPVENPDADGQCQPEHTPKPEADQPQGGERQDGKIYVTGFGWIEDHGGGSDVQEAPNAGTGKPVGEM